MMLVGVSCTALKFVSTKTGNPMDFHISHSTQRDSEVRCMSSLGSYERFCIEARTF